MEEEVNSTFGTIARYPGARDPFEHNSTEINLFWAIKKGMCKILEGVERAPNSAFSMRILRTSPHHKRVGNFVEGLEVVQN